LNDDECAAVLKGLQACARFANGAITRAASQHAGSPKHRKLNRKTARGTERMSATRREDVSLPVMRERVGLVKAQQKPSVGDIQGGAEQNSGRNT
jgi:hypothetical protein